MDQNDNFSDDVFGNLDDSQFGTAFAALCGGSDGNSFLQPGQNQYGYGYDSQGTMWSGNNPADPGVFGGLIDNSINQYGLGASASFQGPYGQSSYQYAGPAYQGPSNWQQGLPVYFDTNENPAQLGHEEQPELGLPDGQEADDPAKNVVEEDEEETQRKPAAGKAHNGKARVSKGKQAAPKKRSSRKGTADVEYRRSKQGSEHKRTVKLETLRGYIDRIVGEVGTEFEDSGIAQVAIQAMEEAGITDVAALEHVAGKMEAFLQDKYKEVFAARIQGK